MIIAGFGFRASATVASLQNALSLAATSAIDALAAPDDKCTAPCLNELSVATGLPILPVTAKALTNIKTPTQSTRSLRARNTGSVAEAAALAAAGPKAKLLSTRQISKDKLATCAIATGSNPTGSNT
ncbi:MAG: cobalamin biosynthesis protein [Rhodobacteraceae bacterium]|nr:cobalamin biosynthesis protein [Paracoccaceae bacterium]